MIKIITAIRAAQAARVSRRLGCQRGPHEAWAYASILDGNAMTDTDLRHKLAAILAADVAGYSRLMAGDDRATVAALDVARAVFRTQIETREGRVIDMAGDSVLAVFGTAAGAVSAALAIQAQIHQGRHPRPAGPGR